jgi:RNA polymerase sigma-70 factor (ECF subfamily)
MAEAAAQTDRERSTEEDGQLVRRTVAGDRKAFDALVRKYQRQAVGVSFRLLGNSNDAAEVVQDAFLKAYTNLVTLDRPEAFCGWLLRIVSNLSLNKRRGRRKSQPLPGDDGFTGGEAGADDTSAHWRSAEHDPIRLASSGELGPAVREALDRLPEKQRLAIVLFTIEEMPQKQVAEVLECSVEAVKWHVFQGRKKLKDMLQDYL